MLNQLTARDFISMDTRDKLSFLHFDNIIPFVSSVLETAESWNKSDEVIVTTVEGIIQRSGHLMKEYSNLNDQYRPMWADLSPLEKCSSVLDILSTQAK